MTKYYVEIVEDATGDYVIQSRWFDTKKEAINWAKTIDYVSGFYAACLMKADFNKDGEYNDIIQVKILF